MKTSRFTIMINAPKQKVWGMMLDPEGYKSWTTEFADGSYYEGSWEKGERIRFLSPGGEGMAAVIVENQPFEFISIKHLGFVKDGIEDTESPEIKAWAPIFENYTFRENNGVTDLQVDIDVISEWAEYIETAWPKALLKLKMICE